VKFGLPLLEPHGLDYPDTGSWQPITQVLETMDLDRFTLPATIRCADVRQPLTGNEQIGLLETTEVRLMVTARVRGDIKGKINYLKGEHKFIHSKYDSIIYEFHLLDEESYAVTYPQTFKDMLPQSILKINETTAEGREQNASFKNLEDRLVTDNPMRLEKFSDACPLRIKVNYEKKGDGLFVTPLRVVVEVNKDPAKWVERKRFTQAADSKDYEIESFQIYHPNKNPSPDHTGVGNNFVWVPRPTLGLMNWWPVLP